MLSTILHEAGAMHVFSMFREAIKDLGIAINLNKDLLDVRETMFHLILGLFEQREVRVFGRWHRPRVYGLSKDNSDWTGELPTDLTL